MDGKIKLSVLKTAALGSCSILAILASPHLAAAACSPNPAQDYTTTTCTGAETGGLTVAASDAYVTIGSGAVVSAPAGGNAITITSGTTPYQYYGSTSTLYNYGIVNGGASGAGIFVTNAAYTPGSAVYPNVQTNIIVQSGGVIEGLYGVKVAGAPGNAAYYYTATAALTNSGTISGSSGIALYAGTPSTGYFTSINNLSGGQIGAISGLVQSLNNAGTINGGSLAAVSTLSRTYYYDSINLTNLSTGTITSSNSVATLALNSNSLDTVVNAGVISNSGGGAAIKTANALNLTNTGGVINGNVVISGSSSSPQSTIDNTGGTINGSLTLGAGGARVIADFGTTANPISGISGGVISGGGANTLQLNIKSDATLTAAIAASTAFQKLTYGIGGGATLTFAAGLTTTSTVYLAGTSGGNFINNGVITTTGAAIVPDGYNFYGSGIAVTNNGQITANLTQSGGYAIDQGIYGLGAIVNTGGITAIGGSGINAEANGTVTNSGVITADATGISAFDNVVTNSGTIHSNNGVGFYGFGNSGTPASNSGVIYGQTAGAELFGYTLTNSGTISSPGVGVSVDPYGSLINASGGTINGGVGSILYGFTFNATVINAGTINGDVNLGYFPSYYGSGNTYFAQTGGILNGNLVLGSGNDTLIVNLNNTGSGQFAGITGTVTGGGSGTDTLRYLVTADTTSTITAPSLFGVVKYDLANNAKLTLTGSNLTLSSLGFSGVGTVDLTANLTGTGTSTILDLTQTSLQTTGASATVPETVLTFTSRGALTQTHNSEYNYAAPAVILSGSSSFTNAGTITVQDLTPSTYGSRLAAISGTGTVVNSGVINVAAADAIVESTGYSYYGSGGSTLTVVNSGSITQIAGGGDGRGIVNADTVTNTGSISTGGSAVVFAAQYGSGGTLVNSGSIISANAAAVVNGLASTYSCYYCYAYGPSNAIVPSVANQAGGVISGMDYGVIMNVAGSVANAGLISGGEASVIFYGSGANTLTLQTGSTLIGDAVGSTAYGASNTLILQGAGVANNAFVNFNALNAEGSGAWTLGGASRFDAVTVTSGALIVNGALTSANTTVVGGDLEVGDANHPGAQLISPVTITTGGALSGHGTVVGNVANTGGVVAPGGSIGVLTINGNYSQSANGVLSIEISPSANSALRVTGTATLSGSLMFVVDPGVYRKGAQFSVLSAEALVGGFNSFQTSTGLSVGLNSSAAGVTASVLASNFTVTGGTANQNAIGAAFANYAVGVSDFDPVANALIALPSSARQNQALDTLGGEVAADFLSVSQDTARGALNRATGQLSDDARLVSSGKADQQAHVWGHFDGETLRTDSSGGAHGFNQTTGGGSVGVEKNESPDVSLGADLSYDHTDLALRGLTQRGGFDGVTGQLYAERRWGGVFVDGAASLAYDSDTSVRQIIFPGVSRTAKAAFDDTAEAGWTSVGVRSIVASDIWVEPSLGLSYVHIEQGGFTEHDAGGADLQAHAQTLNAMQSVIALRLSKAFAVSGGTLRIDSRIAGSTELTKLDHRVNESFAAEPGTDFAVTGAAPSREAGQLSLGAVYTTVKGLTFFSRYDGNFSARQTGNGLTLGGRWVW